MQTKHIAMIGLGVVGLLSISKARAAVHHVAQELNPVNPDNMINRNFEKAYGTFAGTSDRPLGVRLYDFLHPAEGIQDKLGRRY